VAWRERRTLLIGLMVLAVALVEGTANDWLALALVDGYGASHAVGAVGFAVFVAAMTAGRISGTWLLDRYSRVVVLRVCTGTAIAGVVVFVFGGSLALALAGAALWGIGASLGFPVGMSAASDDQRHAAARVSVVASIGYTAFLAGPPLIGLLGDRVGVLRALLVILVALVLSFAVTGAARPLPVVAVARD
jgi:fucose permease